VAIWSLLALLVLIAAGLVVRSLRRRPPATREAAVVAPVTVPVPVGVRIRVDSGVQTSARGPGNVATGARVRLGVRMAEARPKEANLAQVPLGAGRVVVRTVEGEVPRLTEEPETVSAGRVRVAMSDDPPDFWPGDGESVILKRR